MALYVLPLKHCVYWTVYFCRSLIYPFLIRGGKSTPFISFALAFVFCIYNGYLQTRYLSHYAEYPPDWVTRPYFITGRCFLTVKKVNFHLFQD